jgi:hypothetical protein
MGIGAEIRRWVRRQGVILFNHHIAEFAADPQRYFVAPKYFKGQDKPRLGDIAYSERVMFGF